jgi:hypothetical protein
MTKYQTEMTPEFAAQLAKEQGLTPEGEHLRLAAATGSDIMEPWSFVPCARDHGDGNLCIRKDGHDPVTMFSLFIRSQDEWGTEHNGNYPTITREEAIQTIENVVRFGVPIVEIHMEPVT